MKKMKKRILIFVGVILMITPLTTIGVSSQENKLSNEETFELLVRKSLGIEDDEALTENHFEDVTSLSTTFHDDVYNTNGRESQQLTDLSLLAKLPNLNSLTFNPLKDNPVLPVNISVLSTLSIDYVELGDQEGYGSQVDVTDEQRLALTKVYREFLDSYDGEKLESVLIKDDQISNYQWLLGLDMSDKVGYIYNAYTELSSNDKIKLNYEFSHYDEDGIKIYKMNFISPLSMLLDLSNNAIIEEDSTYKNVNIQPMTHLQTIENSDSPIFYDINGNIVEQNQPGHYSVDLFFPEPLLEELQEQVKTEIKYMKENVETYQEIIEDFENDLLTESDPKVIELLEGQIRDYNGLIVKLEGLIDAYETEGISNIRLFHISIMQDISDTDSSNYIFLHNDYEIMIGREVPEFYTVNFESNGGTPIDDIMNVEEDTKIIEPNAPTKAGHKFLGWYKESTLENEWNFNVDVVLEDTTLYARWEEVEEVPKPEEETIYPKEETQEPEESSPNNQNVDTGINNDVNTYLFLIVVSSLIIINSKYKKEKLDKQL